MTVNLPFLHRLLLDIPGAANAVHKQSPLLCVATECCNIGAVHLLLLFGANVNATDNSGATAVHIAAAQNLGAITKVLLGRRALAFPSYQVGGVWGSCCEWHPAVLDSGRHLHAPSQNNSQAARRVLGVRWEQVKLGDAEAAAAAAEDAARERQLSRRNRRHRPKSIVLGEARDVALEVDVNARTAAGATPLFLAAKAYVAGVCAGVLHHRQHPDVGCVRFASGHANPVEYLLTHHHFHRDRIQRLRGRTQESDEEDGAVPGRWPSVVDADAKPSASGHTPLCVASAIGCVPVVRRLLRWGASVNATGADGYTPLMLAVSNGTPRCLWWCITRVRQPHGSMWCHPPVHRPRGASRVLTREVPAYEHRGHALSRATSSVRTTQPRGTTAPSHGPCEDERQDGGSRGR